MSVVYVDSRGGAWVGRAVEAVAAGRTALDLGLCRIAESDAACRDILARATPPSRCSSAIPVAPAPFAPLSPAYVARPQPGPSRPVHPTPEEIGTPELPV